METPQEIITYWLCPAEPARTRFAKIINDLAARFDAPVFEPHVTLYVAGAAGQQPRAVLDGVMQGKQPFRLTVRGVDYSDKFTKTLFVQFEPNTDLAQFSDDLQRASARPSDYELNPHLSLIYKEMDIAIKRQLASSIALPFTDVMFDNVKAVLSPAKVESRRDVEAWRVVAERKLTT
jgi:2'-5' RNA ligase